MSQPLTLHALLQGLSAVCRRAATSCTYVRTNSSTTRACCLTPQVVSAPTGAGKTGVMELAILRLLSKQLTPQAGPAQPMGAPRQQQQFQAMHGSHKTIYLGEGGCLPGAMGVERTRTAHQDCDVQHKTSCPLLVGFTTQQQSAGVVCCVRVYVQPLWRVVARLQHTSAVAACQNMGIRCVDVLEEKCIH